MLASPSFSLRPFESAAASVHARSRQLDGLRGLAVLSVVFHHSGFVLPGWLDWGPLGVRMLLLMTGYLVTLSLGKLSGSVQSGQKGWIAAYWEFQKNRMCRIVPPLYSLLVTGFLLGLPEFRSGWMWHAGFLTNWLVAWKAEWPGTLSHLWSLALQVQFYLMWPFLFFWFPRRWIGRMLGILLVAPVFFRLGCIAFHVSPYWRWMVLPGMLDVFAWGAWLAWWQIQTQQDATEFRDSLSYKSALVLGSGKSMQHAASIQKLMYLRQLPSFLFRKGYLPMVCGASFVGARILRNQSAETFLTAGIESLECLFLVGVLHGTLRGWNGWFGMILSSRWLSSFGLLGYGIYLFHPLLHSVLVTYLPALRGEDYFAMLVRFVVLVWVTIPVAYLCSAVEGRCLRRS